MLAMGEIVLSLQFLCKSKTILKYKHYFKKRDN